jgi:N-acetylglutamate synthase-like GNAT family acetyltransferase
MANRKIRKCNQNDFGVIDSIINDAAQAYKGAIPPDCWKEPYMSEDELQREIEEGVVFWGYEEEGEILGVMGLQHVQDVSLIRHAYVRLSKQRQGIAEKLLYHLQRQTTRPILIGTWVEAAWAIRFYERNGYGLVSPEEKNRLLKKYWSVPERQIECSVVLAKEKWFLIR